MASVVASTIAKGRIVRIDASEALRVDGVLDVLTHENRPHMADTDHGLQGRRRAGQGSPFRPLYDDSIHVQRTADRAGAGRGMGDCALRRVARARRIRARKRMSPTSLRSRRSRLRRREAGEAARRTPTKASCRGRGAPRGRIFHSDGTSQPHGVVRRDGGLGRRRQAHGLRQDPGRAERAALSVRRVRHEAGRSARDVALMSAARSARGCARNTRRCSRCWRRGRSSARCASC